jgi:hypothetical protein
MSPIGDDGLFALPPPELLGNVDILHMEIAEFAAIARPSPDARICAEAAVDCVREAVKQLWPGTDVEVRAPEQVNCSTHSQAIGFSIASWF